MASSSDADKKSAGRAGLPFEPNKSSRKKSASASNSSDAEAKQDKSDSKKSDKKASKANKKKKSSSVSASAQARVDEIRAMNRRKAEKKTGKGSTTAAGSNKKGRAANSGAIPEEVSQRMLRRMGVLSGGPVFLGVGVFFLAYYLRSNEIIEFAPIVVLLATMGCFGLGVLGLTYGVLSASWDSEPGSLVGLSEFKLNFGRIMEARRASKT